MGDSLRLTVRGPIVTADAGHGDSIQVSGVCLTVIEQGAAADGAGTFTADVMEQSVRMSTLGELAPGDRVNLERAARVDSRLGGHIVQGHVDGTARLLSVTPHDNWKTLRFALDPALAPLLVDEGSVTLSGVSLTVSSISGPADPQPWFEVSLIPETLSATTLGALAPGDRVNLRPTSSPVTCSACCSSQTPPTHRPRRKSRRNPRMTTPGISTIEEAIAAIKAGRPGHRRRREPGERGRRDPLGRAREPRVGGLERAQLTRACSARRCRTRSPTSSTCR